MQRMNRWIKRKSIPNWKPRHHPSTPSTDTPKRNRKTIKKRKSAAVTPDGEESTTPSEDSSPIIPQMQSSYLNVGSPGQEWPLSPDTFSQSTCAYDAPYSQSTVGNSVSPPWNAEPSANDVPHSSYPIMQQIQLGSLDDGSSGHEWPPSRAASSQSTCGSYPIMQQIQSGSLDDGSSGHEWPPSPAASSQLTCGSYPIMQQIQSGSLDDGFSGHEWPPSPAASSQSTCGYGAAYQSAVGSSALPPWDVVSSANCGRSVLQSDRGPRYGEGHYAYAPESSCYSQSVMPESANFQPLRDIESESQESLFSKRDFYSASPTNLVESNFVWSMLEYTRSHYRSVMSREPPVTTFGATYTCQYNELQDHVKQLWPYSNPPPDLRAIAPISTMSYRTM